MLNYWIKNVETIDADAGVILSGARFGTLTGCVFRTNKRTTGKTGHHAVFLVGNSQDNLITNFTFKTAFIHDLTVEGLAHGNVFSRGTGTRLCFDHHRNAPYENLFTDLNVGDASRLWSSSGTTGRGPQSAARSTVWNIRKTTNKFPAIPNQTDNKPDWFQLNVVGLAGITTNAAGRTDQWVEGGDFTSLEPANLYDAQLAFRKAIASLEAPSAIANGVRIDFPVSGMISLSNTGSRDGTLSLVSASGRIISAWKIGALQMRQLEIPRSVVPLFAVWRSGTEQSSVPVPSIHGN